MKVGLIDVDSHNYPNLCLMKISAYFKAKGAEVEFCKPGGFYDRVYTVYSSRGVPGWQRV